MDANVMGPTNRQSDGAIHLPGLEGPFTVTRLLTGLLTLLSVTDHVSSTPSHLSIFRQLVEGGGCTKNKRPLGQAPDLSRVSSRGRQRNRQLLSPATATVY
ncbi:hypothetical protein V2G26_020540 [Clonostachys chloroleuca]